MVRAAALRRATGGNRLSPLYAVGAAAALSAVAVLSALSARVVVPPPDALSVIQQAGVLRVAALDSEPYCYTDDNGEVSGFECDLLRGFAGRLGVRFDVKFFGSISEVIDAVRLGRADVGAGGVYRLPEYRRYVRLGPTVRQISEQLVYNRDGTIPQGLDRLHGDLVVPAGSPAARLMQRLQSAAPGLSWVESRDDDAPSLLAQVGDGDVDYTVADSDATLIARQHYPLLRVAFDLGDPEERVWALPLHGSDKLAQQVADYLHQIGPLEMRRLDQSYFGRTVHVLAYVDATHFATDVDRRLPELRQMFVEAGRQYGIDWRLLAAVGYQESHWKEDAVSPTGVRGLMMLTEDTASMLKVSNRADARQSIFGAARYLAQLRDALPDSVTEPDRSWMTLAAYNVGINHLLDARNLTQLRGCNPDLWRDVRKTLPLLARSSWHSKVSHGYARGGEATIFVANIRAYYDILAWKESGGDVTAAANDTGLSPMDGSVTVQ